MLYDINGGHFWPVTDPSAGKAEQGQPGAKKIGKTPFVFGGLPQTQTVLYSETNVLYLIEPNIANSSYADVSGFINDATARRTISPRKR